MYLRQKTANSSGKMSNARGVSIFGWGDNRQGQLGIESKETLHTATVINTFNQERAKAIKDVACGKDYSLFMLQGGSVYCCGKDTQGIARIESLETQTMRHISAGSSHYLAVSDQGQVYSWGSNEDGQLGQDSMENEISVPMLIKSLLQIKVSQISAGDKHTVMLSNDYQVFCCGSNTFGQLGQGHKNILKKGTIVTVESLMGLPVVQISCGSNHTMVLTYSGVLFGWGSNSSGQLGVESTQESLSWPTQCKHLRTQRVTYIACGSDHSVALTSSGGVFTFGAGSEGQLGHSVKENRIIPTKVMELMGSVVTQIACGHAHTLVHVASSNRIYAFGLDDRGQLGLGVQPNSKMEAEPQPVTGPWTSTQQRNGRKLMRQISKDNLENEVIVRIYAGYNHNYMKTCLNCVGLNIQDFRKEIPYATPQYNLVQEMNSEFLPDENLLVCFRSLACFNRAFLANDEELYHNPCKSQHGIDLDLCSEVLLNFMSKASQNLKQTLLEKLLLIENQITQRNFQFPDVESLRYLMLIPYVWASHNMNEYSVEFLPIQQSFARLIININGNAEKIIKYWMQNTKLRHFNHLIKVYKTIVEKMLQSDTHKESKQQFLTSLRCLKWLNEVNLKRKEALLPNTFYIPIVNNKLDLENEYLDFYRSQRSNKESICNFPFIFDGIAKTILLETDAKIQMALTFQQIHMQNMFKGFMAMLTESQLDITNPLLVLEVNRSNLVEDTVKMLKNNSADDYKKPLKVKFIDEDAVDEGGVAKEYFQLIFGEIMKPELFKSYTDSNLLWFQFDDWEDVQLFHLIGVLCGLAIYNSHLVDFKFPLALFKKLLSHPVTLEDLKELEPTIAGSLQGILDVDSNSNEDIYETYCMTFEIEVQTSSGSKTVRLKEKKNEKVTIENRQEFVDAYVDYVFNKGCKKAYESFHKGFHEVLGGGLILPMFQPIELKNMTIGDDECYDWDMLQSKTQYQGEYFNNHEVIVRFWSIFHHDLVETQKKSFLQFLTGSNRIPIQGMQAIKMVIQPVSGADEGRLPVAHTCFNLLDLPLYHDKETLLLKLVIAIEQSEGFALR